MKSCPAWADIQTGICKLPLLCRITKDEVSQLSKRAIERDEKKRSLFLAYMSQNFEANQLVFVDESSVDNRTVWRNRGWAKSGARAVKKTNFLRDKK
jgi:hypothetical protein